MNTCSKCGSVTLMLLTSINRTLCYDCGNKDKLHNDDHVKREKEDKNVTEL